MSTNAATLAYGDHVLHCADLFEAGAAAPVIVNIHGGAWYTGDKSLADRWSAQMLARGVTVVNANYRIPAVDPVATMVIDTLLAISVAAARYPTQRLFLAGDSAGAHIALLAAVLLSGTSDAEGSGRAHALGLAPELAAHRHLAKRLEGLVLYSGGLSVAALDVAPEHEHTERFAGYLHTLGGARTGTALRSWLQSIDPLAAADSAASLPPVLAFTSSADFFHDSTVDWAAAALRHGGDVTLHDLGPAHPLAKHSWQLEPDRPDSALVYDATAAFVLA